MKGFRQFILRGNLVDLAVAVVIGSQFTGLVNSFSKSFVTPVLALFGGAPNLDQYAFKIRNANFTYGAFLTQVISFLIAAAVVYFVIVLPVARLLQLFAKDQAATERPCPVCTRSIPIAAQRCPECTSILTEGSSEELPAPRPATR
jgi:large conductance mechanosensitive channel